jgi:hypothetical protein
MIETGLFSRILPWRGQTTKRDFSMTCTEKKKWYNFSITDWEVWGLPVLGTEHSVNRLSIIWLKTRTFVEKQINNVESRENENKRF